MYARAAQHIGTGHVRQFAQRHDSTAQLGVTGVTYGCIDLSW